MKDQVKSVGQCIGLALAMFALTAADWPSWRGSLQNGVSQETGLVSHWSAAGENLAWRTSFTGRSTPIVMDGRIYVMGRVGEQIDKQEVVACFDAENGTQLWEHRFNVFLTTVPFPRVGWANLAGDPETGNVFAHGVGGLFFCFDRNGKILWQHSLTEDVGRISGYGGRTHTPVVDGDLVILSFVSSSWGKQAPPRHRYFAFDKRTGEVIWMATPGGRPYDFNTYSSPVVSVVNGRRLLIGGNADGTIQAMEIRTGKPVWKFALSKRGINSSVVVEGTRVYASHSEENLDEATMGRVVCIDATGTGDVTQSHEVWRVNQVKAGFSSPALKDGQLFVVDNSGNLYSFDAEDGSTSWEHNLGTVGRGSPVLADGKLYVTETNGSFQILEPGDTDVRLLSNVTLKIGDRTAEIFGSPSISNGSVYFVTEEGLYCLADKNERQTHTSRELPLSAAAGNPKLKNGQNQLLPVPADALVNSGEKLQFRAGILDAESRYVEEAKVAWSLSGLSGTIDQEGTFQPADAARAETGYVVASVDGREARSRIRVLPRLPWLEDFESVEAGKTPANWIGASSRFSVKTAGNTKVLSKPFVETGIQRSYVYIGSSDMADYTIQADLLGHKSKRRIPDMGLVANRYALVMMALRQELQVHSWISELRMAGSVPFPWKPNLWYSMKMRVDSEGDKAVIRGKVWPRSEDEPDHWTIEIEDPFPNTRGTPGLFGNSYAEIFYDNIQVTENSQ